MYVGQEIPMFANHLYAYHRFGTLPCESSRGKPEGEEPYDEHELGSWISEDCVPPS